MKDKRNFLESKNFSREKGKRWIEMDERVYLFVSKGKKRKMT